MPNMYTWELAGGFSNPPLLFIIKGCFMKPPIIHLKGIRNPPHVEGSGHICGESAKVNQRLFQNLRIASRHLAASVEANSQYC